ncbi:hypothetical protein CERSUDRAFT_93317 [Gelatoporia subvermispora B]|uniref:Cytochrome P450 n=1 Tax=Ceriporiopsis subvermispora (strain B) TaxID=914234 RepID=M2RLC3_CERS8|nr:hypothetical protein CERSUDRAFT_93317 [Gelatoporia subvermispora B]
MSLNSASVLPVAGAFIAIAIYIYMRAKTQALNRPLPPGPNRLPIVGNIFDIPAEEQWKAYAQWAHQYGTYALTSREVIYLEVLGQPIVVLNTEKAVLDLWDKRSSNYSDRPHSEMLHLIEHDWSFAHMRYGQLWRRHRRTFHQFFHQNAVKDFEKNLVRIAPQLLKRLYEEPAGFMQHIRHVAGAQILSVTYGIEAAESDDEYMAVMERAMSGISQAFKPPAVWVDYLPFLKYVLPWVPGAGFKQKVAQWKADGLAMKQVPWRNVVRDGPDIPIAVKLMERISHLNDKAYAEEERIAENVAGVAYGGGADTTIGTLQFFILAMSLFPEVQKRAQEKLDRVVGLNRLPIFSDRASLPYLNALCKECLRWTPVLPLGLAHQCLEDDAYNGNLIPGGTILFQNTWAILRDPKRYPEPEEFRPERFLKEGKMNPDVLDPAVIAFGAGRRVCPGRYFSELSLFINIASVLHIFRISPAIDSQGQPIWRKPKLVSGVIVHPEPFECTIKPRSSSAETLILGLE